jgi:succinate dehydrogenase / fumarate reductase flavoprotein subunit
MSESLRNDGRIWVPKNPDDTRSPDQIPDEARDYYLERRYPSFGNLAPRDIASRAAKVEVDSGHGVGPKKNGVYLDFAEAIGRLGRDVIEERYGNLFEMYEPSPTKTRTACRCASTPQCTTRWVASGSTTS